MSEFIPRIAVLIDAENVSWKHADAVVAKARAAAGVVQFRAYGNKATCKGWLDALKPHRPKRTSPQKTGKPNAVDMTLMLDAMVYVLRHQVSHVCIVSSDTDYVPLVRHLKALDCRTTVLGEAKTSKALRKACDEFVLLKKA